MEWEGRMLISSDAVRKGKLVLGVDCQVGQNVIVNIEETVTIGDRSVIPDNAYFEGRRIEIGNDWFGYSHDWSRLDIGRGRRDEEDAILRIGSRCTTHDNRIDLAKSVTIGNDVGLSPECCIYTHGYWQSVLDGFPCSFKPVEIKDGVIVGFRSTILPGSTIGKCAVIGAHSLVHGDLAGYDVYGGVTARRITTVVPPTVQQRENLARQIYNDYLGTLLYRKIQWSLQFNYPWIGDPEFQVDVNAMTFEGSEDEYTDDLRWFLFTRGIRCYTKRSFRKMRKQ